MKLENGLRNAAIGLTAVALAACGGGGGGTAGIDGTGVTAPPSPSDTIALGTVTAFGSIFVNGVRFDTSAASFSIDGQPGTQDDLDVGDVVLVVGTLNAGSSTDGVANSVSFDDAVEGPIEAGSIDVAAGTLVVLGQTVRVSAATSFDDSIQPRSLDGLAGGDIVEVSGLVASDGSIGATRIELKPFATEFETTGVVSNLDSAALQFEINGLVVDYSGAMLEDFPGGVISDGDLVEVKGGSSLGASGELLATRVELKEDDIDIDDGDYAEIEGFVTRFVSPSDFDVSGLPVTTTSQTQFDDLVPADLGLDVKVEVEGTFNAAGVLVASEVELRRDGAVRIFAAVDSVDAANSSFVVLGIDVTVDALTRIEDDRDDLVPFSLGDLAVGDWVEVRGSELPAGSGDVMAARVERDDADAEVELRGFVETVTEPSIDILGVTITAGAGTQFRDEADNPISSAQFFGLVAPGTLVEADGLEVGTTMIAADEVEIEREN